MSLDDELVLGIKASTVHSKLLSRPTANRADDYPLFESMVRRVVVELLEATAAEIGRQPETTLNIVVALEVNGKTYMNKLVLSPEAAEEILPDYFRKSKP